MFISILSFIIVLGVLVFIHELGHFLAAKLFKMRVDQFSLGFPPRAIGKKIGDTDYCISWIPLGGYVKIAGMIDESLDTDQLKQEPRPWEYRSKPIWQRIIVITAGVIMNLLLGVVIFSLMTFRLGISDPDYTPVIGWVVDGFPAQKANLQIGDRIATINGQSIETWGDMTKIIHASANEKLIIEWIRSNEQFQIEIIPVEEDRFIDGDIKTIGLIGIGPRFSTRDAAIVESVGQGMKQTYFLLKLIVVSLKKIIVGEGSVRELAGPIAIAQMTGDTVKKVGWGGLFPLMALLSVNLALINILPIPALDGGHLVLLIIEGITKRPISDNIRMIVQKVGMAFILFLIVFVIYNDIVRLVH